MSEEEGSGQQEKMLAQLKAALRQVLDEKAYTRMMNVMLVNQELFGMASQRIIAVHNKLGRTLTENDVLTILQMLKQGSGTGGISIKRK